MVSESTLFIARQNLALVWGVEGISDYMEFDPEFEFEKDLGTSESALWNLGQTREADAHRAVERASDSLIQGLSAYKELSFAVDHAFGRHIFAGKEFYLLNLTYDTNLSSLESIVEEYYDIQRMQGIEYEIAEKRASTCQLEFDELINSDASEVLLKRIISMLSGASH